MRPTRTFKYILAALINFSATGIANAQHTPQTEIFCGAELSYADVNFIRLYDVLINLTPSVKYHPGKGWTLSGQVFYPIVNQGYGKRNNMLRLNMADISKEIHFSNARQHLKISAGLFGMERYGADIRWMFPVTSWLMIHSRLGITSHWALGTDFKGSSESDLSTNGWSLMGLGGASIWLNPWATELRGQCGRYLNEDYGAEGEIIRHFRHVSVSLYLQRHQLATSIVGITPHNTSGGFRVIMMLPPYSASHRKVAVRPASNFRLTYNAQADGYSMKVYNTDPEENERTLPMDIPWGTGNSSR